MARHKAESTGTETGTAAAGRPRRTIFILYIPGGAMLGIIPIAVLARLKQLTEATAAENFQVFCGVSTGSIPAGGLNIRHPDNPCRPKLTEEESLQMFCEQGPVFFPEIPQRWLKMITSNMFHSMQLKLDPLRQDRFQVKDIRKLCDGMRAIAGGQTLGDIDSLEKLATKKWLAGGDKAAVLLKCDALRTADARFSDGTRKISELVHVRKTTGMLSRIFSKSVLGGLSMAYNFWAKDYLFDPNVPRRVYEDLFGEARLSDCLRSTYISAYDKKNHRALNFFCRKENLFSLKPGTPSLTSQGNHKIVDAVMASTANPFAFPPHKTEDGLICSDKANIHSPIFCVNEIMAAKPPDTDVKLIILGTGKYLSPDQEERDLIEYNVNFGVLGNFLQGEEIAEMEAYTMSQMRHSVEKTLGKENIIEITPLLSPHSYQESLESPSNDSLDASPENIDRILKTAQRLLIESDDKIRALACMLVENNYRTGHIQEEQYRRISERLGMPVQVHAPEEGPAARPRGLPSLTDLARQAWGRIFPKHSVRAQAIPGKSPELPQP